MYNKVQWELFPTQHTVQQWDLSEITKLKKINDGERAERERVKRELAKMEWRVLQKLRAVEGGDGADTADVSL